MKTGEMYHIEIIPAEYNIAKGIVAVRLNMEAFHVGIKFDLIARPIYL